MPPDAEVNARTLHSRGQPNERLWVERQGSAEEHRARHRFRWHQRQRNLRHVALLAPQACPECGVDDCLDIGDRRWWRRVDEPAIGRAQVLCEMFVNARRDGARRWIAGTGHSQHATTNARSEEALFRHRRLERDRCAGRTNDLSVSINHLPGDRSDLAVADQAPVHRPHCDDFGARSTDEYLARGPDLEQAEETFLARDVVRARDLDHGFARDAVQVGGGRRCRQLEDLFLRYRPKLIYTNPTFQNPSGLTLPIRARRELIALAKRYRVPVVEDETYCQLSLNHAPPPALHTLDEEGTVVIRVNSFSKVLAPGLRLGWIGAAPPIIEQLALMKQQVDPHTQNLIQLVVSRLIDGGIIGEQEYAFHRRRGVLGACRNGRHSNQQRK